MFQAFVPLSLPIIIHDQTVTYYDYVGNTTPGEYLLMDRSGYVIPRLRLMATALPTFLNFWRSPLKLIIYHSSTEGLINTISIIETLLPAEDKAARTYGEDYVILPFVAGFETGWAAWCANPREVTPADFFGTPWDDIPMLRDINDGYDIKYVEYTGLMIEAAVRVYGTTYGMNMIQTTNVGAFDRTVGPYYPRYVKTYFFTEFIMELEQMLNYPGLNMRVYAAKATYSAMILILIAILNIAWYMESRERSVTVEAGR
jgi:hypothetical protein